MSNVEKEAAGTAQQRQLEFRSAMARLGAAVNIVTTEGPAGRRGLTASAVCSVTDSPPTVLICVNRQSACNAVFKANGLLCVNILASRHRALCQRFAGQAESAGARFGTDHRWVKLATGAPVLEDATAAIDCRITQIAEIGTHSVFFAEVVAIHLGEQPEGLIYFDRDFHRVSQIAAIRQSAGGEPASD